MKIIKIHISGFGKLQNKTYNFSDLNQIIAENGNGKTTLATFIECMFYGIGTTSKDSHRRFLPWNNTTFGGYIIFENNGKIYKLQRTFGTKKSEDTFCLYDQNDIPCQDFTENIGEELFNLEKKAFLSSCIFSLDTDFAFNDQAVYQRLNNIITQSDDLDGFDKKLQVLEKQIKEYENAQHKGIIPSLRVKIEEIKNKIAPLLSSSEVLQSFTTEKETALQDLQKLKEEITKQESLIEKLVINSSSSSQRAKQEFLDKQIGILKDKMQQEKDKILNKPITNLDIKNLQSQKQELTVLSKEVENLKHQLTIYSSTFSKPTPTLEEVEQIKSTYLELEKTKQTKTVKSRQASVNKGLGITMIFISVLMLILGCVYIKKYTIFSVGMFIVGALFLTWAIITLTKKPLNNYQQQISLKNKIIADFLYKYGYGGYDITNALNLIQQEIMQHKQKQLKLEELNKEITYKCKEILQLKQNLFGFFALYGLDDNLENINILSQVCQNIEYFNLQINTLLQEKTLIKIDSGDQAELEKVKGIKQKLVLDKEVLEEKISKINTDIASTQKDLTLLKELNQNLNITQQELKDALLEKDILQKTLYCLNLTKQNLTQGCLKPIIETLNNYTNSILPQYKNFIVNEQFKISFEHNGIIREFESLSLGEKQIVFLCVRLGIIFATFKNNLPFFIIDDAFAPLDEKHLAICKELLIKISKKLQILYLAPTENRKF